MPKDIRLSAKEQLDMETKAIGALLKKANESNLTDREKMELDYYKMLQDAALKEPPENIAYEHVQDYGAAGQPLLHSYTRDVPREKDGPKNIYIKRQLSPDEERDLAISQRAPKISDEDRRLLNMLDNTIILQKKLREIEKKETDAANKFPSIKAKINKLPILE